MNLCSRAILTVRSPVAVYGPSSSGRGVVAVSGIPVSHARGRVEVALSSQVWCTGQVIGSCPSQTPVCRGLVISRYLHCFSWYFILFNSILYYKGTKCMDTPFKLFLKILLYPKSSVWIKSIEFLMEAIIELKRSF